jgi:hypothetical protein
MLSARREALTNEDTQDDRIYALEQTGVSDAARLLALEEKTQHQEGESDHTRHGRRLQATDRITVDSVADGGDAVFDARCEGFPPAQAALKLEFGAANEAGRIICDTDELRAEVQSASTTRTAWTVQRTSGLTKFHQTVEVRRGVGEGDAQLEVRAFDASGDAELLVETDSGRTSNKKRLRIRAAVGGEAEFELDPGLTRHTFLGGDLQIKNSAPRLYLTDDGDNPDFSLGNISGILQLRDETAGRNVLESNSVGDLFVGVAGATSAIQGNLSCNANATVIGQLRANDIVPASAAHITVKDATTVSIGRGSTLSTSNGFITLDVQGFSQQGLGLPVIATAGADAMCLNAPRDGVACFDSGRDRLVFKGSGTAARIVADSGTSQVAYLPIYHDFTLRSTPVTGFVGSTTAWTTLSGLTYPTLTLTVQENDWIRLTGTMGEDFCNYAHIASMWRLVARRGSSTGALITNLDPDHVLCSAGGDNSTEFSNITWPTTTTLITAADAGLVWIGWEIWRRTTDAVTLVAEGTAAKKQVSTVQVEHLRRCVVPTV